jgi:hypothetical protein
MSSATPSAGPGAYSAFEGPRRLAAGPLDMVVAAAKAAFDTSRTSLVLIFDDATGEQIDADYSGTPADVLRGVSAREARRTAPAEAEPATPRGPGRPRLGVVPREVTLLPRHWQWLNSQPGGASVALRRLVDEARRASVGRDRVRRAQEVSYRVMTALAGDLPGFEDALRALFARDGAAFDRHVAPWPDDVRDYARRLASPAFEGQATR